MIPQSVGKKYFYYFVLDSFETNFREMEYDFLVMLLARICNSLQHKEAAF